MRKFFITCQEENFLNDLNETIRSFYPHIIQTQDGEEISLSQTLNGAELKSSLKLGGAEYSRIDEIDTASEILIKRYKKRYLKLLLYKTLSDILDVELPWGSLTGIRPTKLAYELEKESEGTSIIRLNNDFYVSSQKCDLVKDILQTQKDIYDKSENGVDLYINIPFCVSRCSYCSFVSAILEQKKKLVEPYVEAIVKELNAAQEIILRNGYKLRAIYCGGGTPTAFSAENLYNIFKSLSLRGREFTVECGRPDSINEDKLKVLNDVGVSRISINPQTFNQSVLENIGRKHSIDAIYDAFNIARKYSFDINMDLIADLPGDDLDSFLLSVDKCIGLNPENITVHTLSIKHSSSMDAENYDNRKFGNSLVSSMVDGARQRLNAAGYLPYYLYRQKYTSGNLENTGYAKPDKVCIYNVDVMEETTSTVSCGAGGISKRVTKECSRIERQGIVKNIEQYIRDIDEIIDKKAKFFDKNGLH